MVAKIIKEFALLAGFDKMEFHPYSLHVDIITQASLNDVEKQNIRRI
jgi:hypothetical protein